MLDLKKIKETIKREEIVLLTDLQLKRLINRKIILYCNDNNISVEIEKINELNKKIFNEYRGLGILEELINRKNINEIMINSYKDIFIEDKGLIVRSNIFFDSKKEYERIIQKIVGDAGKEVNISDPIVNLTLYDGSRVNIILPPITKEDPCVTIRKFSKDNIKIKDLIYSNTISKDVAEFLRLLVISKYNIIIGGGTSSGKTTFLNALTEYIPDNERIITIEDARELKIIGKENLISLETRKANSSNKGSLGIKELIKNSLRMRPDRIIVGEVRADETLDMLQVMNTGHEGSLTTAHANSTEDMISRLETMVLRSSDDIPLEAVNRMINSAIEIIIHLRRVGKDKRRVVEISEILQDNNGNTKIHLLYKYNYKKDILEKVADIIFSEKMDVIYE